MDELMEINLKKKALECTVLILKLSAYHKPIKEEYLDPI